MMNTERLASGRRSDGNNERSRGRSAWLRVPCKGNRMRGCKVLYIMRSRDRQVEIVQSCYDSPISSFSNRDFSVSRILYSVRYLKVIRYAWHALLRSRFFEFIA